MKKIYALLFALLMSLVAEANVTEISPQNTKIGFSITKFKINADVNGIFKEFSGRYSFDQKSALLSSIEVSIVAGTVDTQEPERDDNLRNKSGFLEVKKHPEIKFVSEANQSYKMELNKAIPVKGLLTIKNITKPVDLMVTYLGEKNGKTKFGATTTINRNEFGVSYNKDYNGTVIDALKAKFANKILGDEVKIDVSIL